MGKLTNIGINRNMLENLYTENTVPFEVDASKKLNYHESDVLLIDLAELVDMNPDNVSECEKQITEVFLETLLVSLDMKVVIDITTSPYQLACFFLTAIRSMPQQFRNEC